MGFPSPDRGPAAAMLQQLRRAPLFRRAHIEARIGKGTLARLIVGIGQVHPVLSGKFEGFQAHRIAATQAWIFRACAFLKERFGVSSFGQEGFSRVGSQLIAARLDEAILAEWKTALRDPADADCFLHATSDRWRRALRRGNGEQAAKESTALNGLALLQALDPAVTIFPIEQRRVHGLIGDQIDALQQEITRVEASSAYQAGSAKGGKGLTKEEYDALVRRNALTQSFNKTLTHPERDRSIFYEIIRNAERSPLTVFVLGQAHRPAQLRLAREHAGDDALYVWITPPMLWWWGAVLRRIGWTILTGLVLLGVLWYAFAARL